MGIVYQLQLRTNGKWKTVQTETDVNKAIASYNKEKGGPVPCRLMRNVKGKEEIMQRFPVED